MLVAILIVVAVVAGVTLWAKTVERKVRAITWQGGERWVRAFPNPGFRIAENLQWSKTYGKGRR